MKNLDHIKLQVAETSAIPQEAVQQLTAADIRACANGLRDGMGAHADYCAAIMEHLANNMVAGEPVGELRVMGGIKSGYTYANASKYPDGTKLFVAPQEPVNQQLLAAAMLAKNKIQQDRNALQECHADPRTGLVTDAAGLMALQGYDAVLSSLDAAIVAAPKDPRQAFEEYHLGKPFAAPAPTIKLGIYGKAFDSPQTRRAYTYGEQPDNVAANKLGRAVLRSAPGGDGIDYGLSLLKHLQAEGFGVFELGDQQKGGA